MLPISVVLATPHDLPTVLSVLSEAVTWLKHKNMSLWSEDMITPELIGQDIAAGLFYIAFYEGSAVGVFMFQDEDLEFWPDICPGESMFIHRLARRSFAGGSVSVSMMQWAVEQCQNLGKQYLRLDCVADRSRLRSIYEKFGFQHHSNRQVGIYFVARYQYQCLMRKL
jgi:GNAT superfamily N-acetyltransferase